MNVLGEHIENLGNTLGTWWEHFGNIVGKTKQTNP